MWCTGCSEHTHSVISPFTFTLTLLSVSRESIHTRTAVTSNGVCACGIVMATVSAFLTLVDICGALTIFKQISWLSSSGFFFFFEGKLLVDTVGKLMEIEKEFVREVALA